jgi:hypothetical protein
MFKCKFVSVNSILLAAVLGGLLPVLAAADSGNNQLTEVFDPFNLLGNGAVGVSIDPGTVTCPDGQLTGNPMQPCSPGSRIKLRGTSGKSRMISPNPLLNGWMYWEINANFDASAAGHAWGTFRLELDAGGVWEGSYSDERAKVEGVNVWVGHACFVGRGTSGKVEGMHLRFTEIALTFMLMPVSWVGVGEADIYGLHHQ